MQMKLKRSYLALLAVMPMLPTISYAAETTANKDTTLSEVAVSAKTISQSEDVDGYLAKKSVSATKTDTLLRDIPQSISVVTQDQIEDQSIQSVNDAVRYVPGVGMSPGEGNRDALIFRGNQTTADFFLDGIRDDVQYFRDFYNIERVEILKGPSGMIFGRGAAGGLLNRVSKEAGWDPIREITANIGSYDNKRIAADFGQALNDIAAFRINAVYEDSGSYRDGVDVETSGINPTMTFLPSDQTKIVLSAEYFNDERTADRGIPSRNGRPFDTDESTFFGSSSLSPTEVKVQNYSALIEHIFDNGVTVRNRTRYSDFDKYYQNVFAAGAVTNARQVRIEGYIDDFQRHNLFNQTDVLFNLTTGSVEHRLLVGTEFGSQDNENFRRDATFNNTATKFTNVSADDPTVRVPVGFNALSRQTKTDINVSAVYLQDQIVLSPKWEAILGLRYDKFDTDFENLLATNPAARNIDTTDEFVSPRAGLIYKPVEPVSLYTSFSQSYVPRAGEQLTSLTPTNETFRPERFNNYEVGAKWDVTPNLALTAAVYKLERNNVQINDPNNTAMSILVDGQETKGVELGFNGRVTSAWSVVGGYAYQDAEITETQGNSNPNNVILAGAELANTPRNSFSLWNRYDINETWGAALGVISVGERFAATPTVGTSVKLPGYTRLDAAVFARLNKNARLQLNIENLLDKEYFLYAHNNNNITPGSPVAARATLILNF